MFYLNFNISYYSEDILLEFCIPVLVLAIGGVLVAVVIIIIVVVNVVIVVAVMNRDSIN